MSLAMQSERLLGFTRGLCREAISWTRPRFDRQLRRKGLCFRRDHRANERKRLRPNPCGLLGRNAHFAKLKEAVIRMHPKPGNFLPPQAGEQISN
jgi:hypothetical protein